MAAIQLRPRARPHFGSAAGWPTSSHSLSPSFLIFSMWGPGLLGSPFSGPSAHLAVAGSVLANASDNAVSRNRLMPFMIGSLVAASRSCSSVCACAATDTTPFRAGATSYAVGCESGKWARIPLADEGTPEVGVGIFRAQSELGVAQGVGTALARKDTLVEALHQFTGRLVGDAPQAHHQRLRP